MSTTRSQKRQNNQQENTESVSEGLVSPIVVENSCFLDQDVDVAGPSRPKSPRIENSLLENLRASLKEEMTSEITSLLIESQKQMLKLLKPKAGETMRENTGDETENEITSFYTPTESLTTISTQNNDSNASRSMLTGVLTDSTSQPKRTKIRSQCQPASKEPPVVARTLYAMDKNDNTTLPMPKALTASLPTFDYDLFRNNMKMYPHFTVIQKITLFHYLLRGDALQAICNIEDSKKTHWTKR